MNSLSSSKNPTARRLLCIGFGDLAQRLTSDLAPLGWQMRGLCRSIKRSREVELCSGDARNPDTLATLLNWQPRQILITLTPDQRDEAAYRRAYLEPITELIAACRAQQWAPHLVFVSSTAVYGEDDGSWVDEQTPALAQTFNGRTLRQTEGLLEASGLPCSVVRFSGIYGRRAMALPSARADFYPQRWTNRIHVRDCIGILQWVLGRYEATGQASALLVGSDLRPVTQGAMENWLRCHAGQPRIAFPLRPSSGRRCRSRRLQELGYAFRVPDFRAGYQLGR